MIETFNAAQAAIRIEGVTAHPMSAKGVLVNPVLVAADLIAPGVVALAPFRPQRFAPAPPGWPAFRDEPTVA